MADKVHRIARKGFSLRVSEYERARPSYPPSVVSHVIDNFLEPNPSSKVLLDLGEFAIRGASSFFV